MKRSLAFWGLLLFAILGLSMSGYLMYLSLMPPTSCPVGEFEGYYTIHSELATMPFTLGKGIRNMDFIVAYPAEFAKTVTLLVQLGLASKEPIKLRGQETVPYDFLASIIDMLPKPPEVELDVDVQRVIESMERA